MKTLLLTAALTATACTPMVSKETQTLLSDQLAHDLIETCPTTVYPMDHWNELRTVFTTADEASVKTAAFNTCRGLNEYQRAQYWYVVNRAFARYRHQYDTAWHDERRRRARAVQASGQVMMDIERNERLRRIDKNTERFR